MADIFEIAGRINSTSREKVVTTADQILADEQGGMKQSDVNAQHAADLANRYTKEETYNKSELNQMITTPDVEHVSVVATNATTAVTDVLPATGEANTIYRVGNWNGTQYDPTMYALLAWNGTTYVCIAVRSFVGEVYDISVNHPDGQGNPTPYADLTAALGTDGANIPADIRRGGMSIQFIKGNAQSSDNNSTKYVQYRLMSDTFNTTPANWQGVDEKPTPGSKNIVESGGVAEIINGPLYIEYGKRFMSNGYALNVSQYACTNKLQGNGDYVFPRIALGYRVFKYISDSEGVELTDGNWKTTELTLTINDPFIVTFNGGSQTPDWSPLNNYSIDGVGTGLKGETEKLKSGKVDKVQGKGLSTEDFTSEEKAKLDALPTNSELTAAFGNKVDKVEGKGLSENDFTDDLKEVVDKVDDNLVCVAGVSSKNMVNLAALVSGYRVLKTNGSLYADASYSYITLDVTGIANLAISASISITSGFAFAFYNGDTFISGDNPDISTSDSYSRKYVSVSVPSNATKMIVSNPTSTWNARNWQIEEGTTSTAYEPYRSPTEPVKFLKDSFLSPIITSILGSGGLRGYAANLSDGQSISMACGSIRKNQRIHFYAKIGTFDTIHVGKGITDKGYLLKIDNTNIQFKAGIDSSGGSEIPHGLTISEYISVLITIQEDGHATIKIDTIGGSYSRALSGTSYWANVKGDIVAISNNSTFNECYLTWNCSDFKKPIWAYGDSYFSHYSDSRWPYYLIVRDNIDCCLLNAFPGEDSLDAYADFLENAKQGAPKILMWCLGMNNPDSNTVNPDWLSVVEKLEDYCIQYGTELILSTIPCVPSVNNTYKNAWVKASGHRYIDFAEAVDAEEAGSTWISGTLSTDNVHPTADGARLLYSRAISDIPELLGGM